MGSPATAVAAVAGGAAAAAAGAAFAPAAVADELHQGQQDGGGDEGA